MAYFTDPALNSQRMKNQMICTHQYRVYEYRISEFADGRLWWDAHAGLGKQIGGPCFVYGDILILGERCSEEDGFLKLEFFNQLRRLPVWNQTRYYCSVSTLMDVSTGRIVRENKIHRLMTMPRKTDANNENRAIENVGKFRLWQYQISIFHDFEMKWTTYGGTGQLFGGSATIKSDILLIGPKEFDDPRREKRNFIRELRSLPGWNQTNLWCRSAELKPIMPLGKENRPTLHRETGRVHSQKRIVAEGHHLKAAKQTMSQLADYYSITLATFKLRWNKRILFKRKEHRKANNTFD